LKACAQIVDYFWRNIYECGNLSDVLAPVTVWHLGELPGLPVPDFGPEAIPLDME
jgi:hypothetical protein